MYCNVEVIQLDAEDKPMNEPVSMPMNCSRRIHSHRKPIQFPVGVALPTGLGGASAGGLDQLRTSVFKTMYTAL